MFNNPLKRLDKEIFFSELSIMNVWKQSQVWFILYRRRIRKRGRKKLNTPGYSIREAIT